MGYDQDLTSPKSTYPKTGSDQDLPTMKCADRHMVSDQDLPADRGIEVYLLLVNFFSLHDGAP